MMAVILLSCLASARDVAVCDDRFNADSGKPADQHVEDVKELVLSQQARLTSLIASIRSWQPGKANTEVYSVVAAKGRSRYQSLWHGSREERHRDPGSFTRFYDGVHWNVFLHYERRYEVTKRFAVQPYLSKIQGHFLFECLGWWPPGDTGKPLRRPDGEPMFLPDILADSRLRRRSQVESVNERQCDVLEIPDVVSLWIDSERGVVRRRQQHVLQSDGSVHVFSIYHFSDFRRYSDDVWLPARIVREFSTRDFLSIHQIDYRDVNNASDDVFSFDPPPGTLVYDRDTDTHSQIPGGLDALEIVSQRVIRESDTSDGGKSPSPTQRLITITVSFLFGMLLASRPARRRLRATASVFR